jgi:hypothetical protein
MAPVVAQPPARIRKKLVRRARPDRSQTLRRAVQLVFFALNAVDRHRVLPVRPLLRDWRALCVGGAAAGGRGLAAHRLADESEGASVSGQMPRLHPAGMFLLIAFLAASWIFRKSFLRLAVSGGDGFGVPLAAGTPDLWTQFPAAAQSGRGVAQPQVPAARLVRVRRGLDVRCRRSAPFWKARTAWWTT